MCRPSEKRLMTVHGASQILHLFSGGLNLKPRVNTLFRHKIDIVRGELNKEMIFDSIISHVYLLVWVY
jgi:hypothetical protein